MSFTDDAGYDETLTSAAFGRVTSIRPTGSVSSITVVVTEDTSDPNNVMTNFVVTWTGDHVCPTDYNTYLNIVGGVDPSGPGAKRTQYHLGSATSGGTEIAKELSGIEGLISYSLNVDLYCGTDAAGQYLRAVSIFWSENRPLPSTYSTEPPLNGLSVNDGTLSPIFDKNEFDYNVLDVANDVTRTTITATPKTGYFVKYYESSERGWKGSAMLSPGHSIVDHPSGLSPDCKRRTTDDLGPMPELTDADPNTPGFQADLYDGVNYVSLFVYPTDYCHYGSGYDLAITRAEGSVSLVRPNRPPTGSIAIEPSYTTHGPCNGCILSAVDYSINDRDGLTDATYSYQWLADDAEIAGATDTSYTVVAADEGKAIKVRVSFTDDAGNDESLTSSATAAVTSNSAATGAPVITGTADVGETLTATTAGIVDADGLVNVSYSYQWISNDGSSDTDIQNATGSSYTLVAGDEGNTIKVKVSFTDDAGNDESLTSAATAAVNFAVQQQMTNSAATGLPVITGTAHVGETLTATTAGIVDADGLVNVSYSYQWISNDGSSDTDIEDATGSSYTLVAGDEGNTIKVKVSFTDDAGNDETLTSSATAAVAGRPNSAATGAPSITGTAHVGSTLTADTTSIADSDGLVNVSYSYQWISNDGSSDTDIQNATGSSYTLVAGDQGNTIKVKVNFTDDAGNDETLTSAATGAVAPSPLTVTLENNPSSHNGTDAFTFRIQFSEETSLSFRTLRDQAFTVAGGTVKKAKRMVKGSNLGWTIHVEPDSNYDVEIVLSPTTDCAATGAICTHDGRKLSNQLGFTVRGPNQ